MIVEHIWADDPEHEKEFSTLNQSFGTIVNRIGGLLLHP